MALIPLLRLPKGSATLGVVGIFATVMAGLALLAWGVLSMKTDSRSLVSVVSTFAGSEATPNEGGYVDGQRLQSQFNHPAGVSVDRAGNVYVADSGNNRLRKIAPDGNVTTIPGPRQIFIPARSPGVPDFPRPAPPGGITGLFLDPQTTASDGAGNIYLSGLNESLIYKVSPAGDVTPIAGNDQPPPRTAPFTEGPFADYRSAPLLGPARDVMVRGTTGIAVDASGNVYLVGDVLNILAGRNQMVRKVTPDGQVLLVAGSEEAGYQDGRGPDARFNRLRDIALDRQGNMYVTDAGNNRIRKITPDGQVSTVAGSGEYGFADGPALTAKFANPAGLTVDGLGSVYIVDFANSAIRKVSPDRFVTTLAGAGNNVSAVYPGDEDGPGYAARFQLPTDIDIDEAGDLYVADRDNNRIRKIVLQPATKASVDIVPSRFRAMPGAEVSVYVYADSAAGDGVPCKDIIAEMLPASASDSVPRRVITCLNTTSAYHLEQYDFVQGEKALLLDKISLILVSTTVPDRILRTGEYVPCDQVLDVLVRAESGRPTSAAYRRVGCTIQPPLKGQEPPLRVWMSLPGVGSLDGLTGKERCCWELITRRGPRVEVPTLDVPCVLR